MFAVFFYAYNDQKITATSSPAKYIIAGKAEKREEYFVTEKESPALKCRALNSCNSPLRHFQHTQLTRTEFTFCIVKRYFKCFYFLAGQLKHSIG